MICLILSVSVVLPPLDAPAAGDDDGAGEDGAGTAAAPGDDEADGCTA
jgi:hypothetical protein